jgi:hypothetical protein
MIKIDKRGRRAWPHDAPAWLRSGDRRGAGTPRTPGAIGTRGGEAAASCGDVGSCTASVRIMETGLSQAPPRHHVVRTTALRPSPRSHWAAGSPMPPARQTPLASCVHRHPPASCRRAAEHAGGCTQGGWRPSRTSRNVQTGSVRPAARAGVRGRHRLAEPVPWVGSGGRMGTRQRAWGTPKLSSVWSTARG